MQIIFHSHNAVISDAMKHRAEQLVAKLAERARRTVDAVVRFERDGPVRRVEILLHAPRCRALVAEGRARTYGPALAEAAQRLQAQLAHVKRTRKARAQTASRT